MTTTTPAPDTSWKALLSSGGIALVIFTGGTTLQAVESFITTAMLPTIVRDIGGLDLFAWSTTLFIISSILATVFAAVRAAAIGPRGIYLTAAASFAAGSLVCGLAPHMLVLLAGRAVQGFGAGLLVSATLAMVRVIFPEPLWPRVMALNALVWGVATLLGPAIGGIFAQYDAWRWAFLIVVPIAGLLAFGASTILPAHVPAKSQPAAPVLQIGLVVVAILLISISSLLTDQPLLAGLLLVLTAADIALLGMVEARAESALFPAGALSPRSVLGTLFLTILLFNLAVTSDIFAPLFLQRLHGLPPLWAGYMTALLAAGWVVGAFITASFNRVWVRRAIVLGPCLIFVGTVCLALCLASSTIGPWGLLPIGIALFAMGLGIGVAFQHLSTSVLASGSAAENDRTSAALGMVQLFASGAGAAIGGVLLNGAGLPNADTPAEFETAARALFWVFAAIAALGIPFAWRAITIVPRLAGDGFTR